MRNLMDMATSLTRPASAKGLVLVYGSCQAGMIVRLMQNAPGLRGDIEFREVTSFERPIGGWDEVSNDDMARVVAVWEMFDERAEIPHRDNIRERTPKSAVKLVYPPVVMQALWPFDGVDVRKVPEVPNYPFGRFPWTDMIAASMAKMDLKPEDIYPKYLEISTKKMPNLDARLEREMTFYRKRDEGSDIKLTDFVFDNLSKIRLFWTVGHLNGPITVKTAIDLIENTGDLVCDDKTATLAYLNAAMKTEKGDYHEQVPIHPVVGEHFKLEWYDPDMTYFYRGVDLTAEEYIRRYVQWDPAW